MDKETDLSRRTGRTPDPRPESVKRAADGYAVCPACGHHTSAYCGSCTAFVLDAPDAIPHYCGCDCVVAMGGKSLSETLREALHGPRAE